MDSSTVGRMGEGSEARFEDDEAAGDPLAVLAPRLEEECFFLFSKLGDMAIEMLRRRN